ncbi:hypothetical protein SBOR_2697 [Sclerotinia borealis F-4128]|uniref:DUF4470 domain-containing protein n=1 Tax=Sclerotinia borealis (strain F-4128) TaxID=1432307 RepID=W9CLL1_SCLBF|nr:hypothetical protein SBOR_2697 [Sclerotinia borealis F-4128]
MASIASREVERAGILRQEGNEFYKSGKLLKAIEKYQESAKLVPESYAPLALELLRKSNGDEDTALIEKLQQRINRARAHSYRSSELEQLQMRFQILDSLPRYRPSLMINEEYYTIGHDQPASLFDLTINEHDPMAKVVSFLFGVIGDARHLIRTISGFAELEKKHRLKQKQYHLSMIDVNKYALTRDLIMFMLLEELSGLETNSEEAEEVLTTLFFVFIAVIIPRVAFDHLHRTIERALSALQSGLQPLIWMYLHEEDFHLYIQSLKSWKGKALTIFTIAAAVDELPAACKKENKLYKVTAILLPPERVLQKHDPQMLVLLKDHIDQPKSNAAKFKTTFKSTGNLTQPSSMLNDAAQSIKYLKGRLQVEAIHGDYVDVAEKLRFKLYRDEASSGSPRATVSNIIRRKDFPVLYDRVHLSNVPDYMGGHLSTFFYASPLLKPIPSSSVESNCLRNSGSWNNLESFLAEYHRHQDALATYLCDSLISRYIPMAHG